ncbi:mitochondrial ATP-dependent RNA helicase [Grosmannia clavigera kw1407]|uniref:RNA helicase n=1 Tax=Grosmannia clavigera (strain kw1407 / UAMH 11150) TaxID=655863 RepID=F0XHY7_GROCL|nr:mitochondrial ATP-dependent RNA helicase [Grosmannia clavigera kw1407]EFX02895.1 mitochondrial ATP-dependent RNA helicase [Grosmannia clavigera kw1407]
MFVLLDAIRTRAPCAARLSRLYSTAAAPLIQRVSTRNHRNLALIRQDLQATPGTNIGSGKGSGRGQGSRRGGNRTHGATGSRKKYALFGALVDERMTSVLEELGPWHPEHHEYLSFGLNSQNDVDRQAKLYRAALGQSLRLAAAKGLVSRQDNALFWSLRNAFVRRDAAGLQRELRYGFQSFALRSQQPKAVETLQEGLADFRYPYEWFPATRSMQRTIHLHVGPTNSGKTYQALQALERARTGIYAGPLRLLAHEIYTRMTAKGRACALITGEEQRIPEDGDSFFQSCTVEMTPLNKRVDVAVIDEIQMMADEDRGWAWTQALLGVQAREVHLCGEDRAVDLVRALCARMGDKCVVHRYERLSALQTMSKSLRGDFGNLRKGDAVVSFSRVGLHTLKSGIEKMTGRRCAIVYGSLPPETRAQQAALFNDPDNDYDFLVASDAIGMGLNLEIKRVIFETATKHDGMSFRHLTVSEIRQIGGRAGRFRTASQAVKTAAAVASTPATTPATTLAKRWGTPGYVATLEDEDLSVVQGAFTTNAEPLQWAGIQPPTFAIERFARYFPPETPFSFILQRVRELSRISGRFRLCTPNESLDVADIIQPFPLSIYDRCVFITAPCALRDPGQKEIIAAMARCVSQMSGGHLLDIPELNLEILDASRDDYHLGHQQYLARLEALHKAITLYLWLSYRYVGVFVSQDLAFHVKSLVEDKITEYLENLTFVPERQQQRAKTLRQLANRNVRSTAEKGLLGDDDNQPQRSNSNSGIEAQGKPADSTAVAAE